MTWLEKIIHPLSYRKIVAINGKSLCIEWTDRADSVLREKKETLNIEMELYFSGMIKKIVIFHHSYKNNPDKSNLHRITKQINVWFHPVTSCVGQACDALHHQTTMDVDIKNLHNYYPKKLNIDYKDNNWEGRFC